MLTIDVILLLIIIASGVVGLFKGFIKSVGLLIGGILSIVLSMSFYTIFAGLLDPYIKNTNISNVVGFLLSFILLNIVFGIVVELLAKIFKLPIINIVNRVLGFAFGVLEAVLILGSIFMFLTKYPITYNLIKNLVENSFMVPVLISCINIIMPLLPSALTEMPTLPAETIPTVIPPVSI